MLEENRLIEGNKRFSSQTRKYPNQDGARLKEGGKEQRPFAVILGCSDSRVPPELIFDQGLGDLFVVRVAGNVSGDVVIESIEYAVGHLKAPLIVILGHSKCEAVKATIHRPRSNRFLSRITSSIQSILGKIRGPENRLERAIKANVKMAAENILTSPTVSGLVESGQVKIAMGYYDVETGIVEYFE